MLKFRKNGPELQQPKHQRYDRTAQSYVGLIVAPSHQFHERFHSLA